MIINKDIKSFGFIKKKETIKSWNNIPNCKCRIFSVINPFPDYLCKSSEDNNCKPYFFLLSIKHTHETNNEQIIKTATGLKNKLGVDLSAYLGQFTLFNNKEHCVRIETENYSIIPDIIKKYQQSGLVFINKTITVNTFLSMLKIYKFFDLKNIAEGIYIHREKEKIKYVEIKNDLEWSKFEKIIMMMKKNTEYKNVDFAFTNILLN